MHKWSFPIRYFCPIRVPIELLRIVFTIIIRQVGDHTDFVEEVPSSSCLHWWPSKQGLETLYECSTFFVCQFTVSFDAFSSMSFHVAGPRYCFCVTFQLLQQNYVIQTSLYAVQLLFHAVCIHAEYIPSIHGQEMMSVHQDPHVSSISSTCVRGVT